MPPVFAEVLTARLNTLMVYAVMDTLSTLEVARMIGIHKQTLLDWLYAGRVREPKRQTVGGQVVRIWTQSDIERVRGYKEQNYCKGRGRKKKV